MATSVVIPNENDYEISYFINNQGNKSLRYKNYIYGLKDVKRVAIYVCSTQKCFASISLETEVIDGHVQVKEPFIVNRINMRHTPTCLPKDESFFKTSEFLKTVKEQVALNPLLPL